MKLKLLISLSIYASSTLAYNASCVSKHLDTVYEQKRIFHALVQDIVLTKARKYSHIGAVHKELQTQLALRQKLRLEFLNKNFPDKIKSTYSKTKDLRIQWDKSHDKDFLKPLQNKILTSKINVLTKQNNSHKDWPEFRKQFKANIFPTERYKKIQTNLFKRNKQSKIDLSKCFSQNLHLQE